MSEQPHFGLWRKFALFQAALTTGLGLACLAVPGWILGFVGLSSDASSTVLLRTFGASLLFVATLHGTLSRSRELPSIRGLLWANLVEDGLLTLLCVLAIVAGTMNGFGWLLAGAFAFEVLAAVGMLLLLPRR